MILVVKSSDFRLSVYCSTHVYIIESIIVKQPIVLQTYIIKNNQFSTFRTHRNS